MDAQTGVRLYARLRALEQFGRCADPLDVNGARVRVRKKRAIRRILGLLITG